MQRIKTLIQSDDLDGAIRVIDSVIRNTPSGHHLERASAPTLPDETETGSNRSF
jgi:hypothetical protein